MNRLNGMSVYLAGPMDDVKDRGVGWRQELTPFLLSLGLIVFDPCKKATEYACEIGDNYDETVKLLKLSKEHLSYKEKRPYLEEVKKTMKSIVSYDLRMVDLSDFVILHVNRDVHACGSYYEGSHAAMQRKPVIVFCDQGIEEIPHWLFGVCKYETFFNNLKEIKSYLLHIDSDILIDDLNRWKFFDRSKIKK